MGFVYQKIWQIITYPWNFSLSTNSEIIIYEIFWDVTIDLEPSLVNNDATLNRNKCIARVKP